MRTDSNYVAARAALRYLDAAFGALLIESGGSSDQLNEEHPLVGIRYQITAASLALDEYLKRGGDNHVA